MLSLEAALLEEPPPPLTQVARRLGYLWTDSLYAKYGELCRKIIARSQNTVGHQPAIPPPPDEEREYRMRRLLEQELREEYPQKPQLSDSLEMPDFRSKSSKIGK